jgi:hypothetical protein
MADEKKDAPIVDVKEFESKLQAAEKVKAEVIAERDSLKKQFKSTQEQLQAFAAKEAEREVAAQKEKEDNEKKALLAKGEYDKALAMERAKALSDLKSRDDIVNNLVEKKFIPSAIKALIIKTGLPVVPEALDDLADIARKEYSFNTDTTDLAVNGKADADPVQHMAEFIKVRPYYIKDSQVKSTGLKPADGGRQKVNAMTLAQIQSNPQAGEAFRLSDPDGYKEVIESGMPKNIADVVSMAKAKKKS